MVDSHAENVVIKEDWYDIKKYSDEIKNYIVDRRSDLSHHSDMYRNYNILYKSIYSGARGTDKQRYTTSKEMFNVYKSALIEGCIPGYSALMDIEGRNPHSVLLAPEVKSAMIEQFKSIALVEKLSDQILFDWILKGEAVAFIKLKQTTEKYREKEVLSDAESKEPLISFKVETGVTYEDLEIEVIDPLDFYVDAMDYKKDPKGCPKIIRSFISSRELLTNKTNYPMLSEQDKKDIIKKVNKNGIGYPYTYSNASSVTQDFSFSKTNEKQIEVLTYRGDYVTDDGKLLTNIKAIVVENKIAFLDYSGVDSLQIVYAPYVIDRETHRGVSPLCSTIPLNDLANRCVDLFLSNLDEVSNPILMYPAGSLPNNERRNFREKRELEYIDTLGGKLEWFTPPEISPNGVTLLNIILNQNKDMLGLNNYISGDTSGSVRTAQESQILFQKANARMRVETDVFSYKFLLPLVSSFYAFNRELALAVKHPLKDIYADPELMISISTGASKADKEGERMRLMEMLNLPIAQMMFSNFTPEQVAIALRYLMAKTDLKDMDNLLELFDDEGNPQYPTTEEDVVEPSTQRELTQGDVVNQEDLTGNPIEEESNIMMEEYNNELGGNE